MPNQSEQKKIPILMYHSISCSSNPRFQQFTVPPVVFAEQMAYLYNHQYTPITVTQLVQARSRNTLVLPERPVVLTFDDGFADFFTAALPVLQQYRFAATLYVASAFIGGTSRWLRYERETTRSMLTWEQLIEISASGIECGSHSHPTRNSIFFPLRQRGMKFCKAEVSWKIIWARRFAVSLIPMATIPLLFDGLFEQLAMHQPAL